MKLAHPCLLIFCWLTFFIGLSFQRDTHAIKNLAQSVSPGVIYGSSNKNLNPSSANLVLPNGVPTTVGGLSSHASLSGSSLANSSGAKWYNPFSWLNRKKKSTQVLDNASTAPDHKKKHRVRRLLPFLLLPMLFKHHKDHDDKEKDSHWYNPFTWFRSNSKDKDKDKHHKKKLLIPLALGLKAAKHAKRSLKSDENHKNGSHEKEKKGGLRKWWPLLLGMALKYRHHHSHPHEGSDHHKCSLSPSHSDNNHSGMKKKLALLSPLLWFKRPKRDTKKLKSDKKEHSSTGKMLKLLGLGYLLSKKLSHHSHPHEGSDHHKCSLSPSHSDNNHSGMKKKRALLSPLLWLKKSNHDTKKSKTDKDGHSSLGKMMKLLGLGYLLSKKVSHHHDSKSADTNLKTDSHWNHKLHPWASRKSSSDEQEKKRKKRWWLLPIPFMFKNNHKDKSEKSGLLPGMSMNGKSSNGLSGKGEKKKHHKGLLAKLLPLGLGLGLGYKIHHHNEKKHHDPSSTSKNFWYGLPLVGGLLSRMRGGSSSSSMSSMASPSSSSTADSTILPAILPSSAKNPANIVFEVEPYYVDDKSPSETSVNVQTDPLTGQTVYEVKLDPSMSSDKNIKHMVTIGNDQEQGTPTVTVLEKTIPGSPGDTENIREVVQITHDPITGQPIVNKAGMISPEDPGDIDKKSLAMAAALPLAAALPVAAALHHDRDPAIPKEAYDFPPGGASNWLENKIRNMENNGEPINWMWMYKNYGDMASPEWWRSKGVGMEKVDLPQEAYEWGPDGSSPWLQHQLKDLPNDGRDLEWMYNNHKDAASPEWWANNGIDPNTGKWQNMGVSGPLMGKINELQARGEPIDWNLMHKKYGGSASPEFWRSKGVDVNPQGSWQKVPLARGEIDPSNIPSEAYRFNAGEASPWLNGVVQDMKNKGQQIDWQWLYKNYQNTASPEWWRSQGIDLNTGRWMNKWLMTPPPQAYTFAANGASMWLQSLIGKMQEAGEPINWMWLFKHYRGTASPQFWASKGLQVDNGGIRTGDDEGIRYGDDEGTRFGDDDEIRYGDSDEEEIRYGD